MRAPWVVVTLLAAWLGAALLSVAVVAPAAFAVLPTRTLAGALVGRVLPVIFWSGLFVGAVAAILLRSSRLALSGGSIAAVACAVAQLIVDPRIAAIRAAVVQPIDTLPVGDPRRAAFGWLHAASVGLLGVAMLGAMLALIAGLLTQRGQDGAGWQ